MKEIMEKDINYLELKDGVSEAIRKVYQETIMKEGQALLGLRLEID